MSILTFGLIAFVLQFCSAVDDDLNPIWEQWKQNHNRSFLNASANLLARVNFERVNDIIRQANNNSRHSFACGHNRFSDWSADQFRSFNAYRHRNAIAKRDIEEPVIKRTILASEAVSMNDWPVTPIRDQSMLATAFASSHCLEQCGSCYIFASVAFLESYYLIKQGQSLDLSEQQVLDCGVGYYNTNINGVYCGQGGIGQCNGGDPACVFAYWLSSTTASSVGYGWKMVILLIECSLLVPPRSSPMSLAMLTRPTQPLAATHSLRRSSLCRTLLGVLPSPYDSLDYPGCTQALRVLMRIVS